MAGRWLATRSILHVELRVAALATVSNLALLVRELLTTHRLLAELGLALLIAAAAAAWALFAYCARQPDGERFERVALTAQSAVGAVLSLPLVVFMIGVVAFSGGGESQQGAESARGVVIAATACLAFPALAAYQAVTRVQPERMMAPLLGFASTVSGLLAFLLMLALSLAEP